jgi:nucleoid-associated protein YgaU
MSVDSSPPGVSRQAQFRRRLIILLLLILLILLLARFLAAAQGPPPPTTGLVTATPTTPPTETYTPIPTSLFTPVVTFSAIPPTYVPITPTIQPTQVASETPTATSTPRPQPNSTIPAKACQGFGRDEGKVWVVSGCDTLASISRATGISLTRLLAANPNIHDPDLIYPGQIIRLPGR